MASHSHTCQNLACGKTFGCVNKNVHTAICPSCGNKKTLGHR